MAGLAHRGPVLAPRAGRRGGTRPPGEARQRRLRSRLRRTRAPLHVFDSIDQGSRRSPRELDPRRALLRAGLAGRATRRRRAAIRAPFFTGLFQDQWWAEKWIARFGTSE